MHTLASLLLPWMQDSKWPEFSHSVAGSHPFVASLKKMESAMVYRCAPLHYTPVSNFILHSHFHLIFHCSTHPGARFLVGRNLGQMPCRPRQLSARANVNKDVNKERRLQEPRHSQPFKQTWPETQDSRAARQRD